MRRPHLHVKEGLVSRSAPSSRPHRRSARQQRLHRLPLRRPEHKARHRRLDIPQQQGLLRLLGEEQQQQVVDGGLPRAEARPRGPHDPLEVHHRVVDLRAAGDDAAAGYAPHLLIAHEGRQQAEGIQRALPCLAPSADRVSGQVLQQERRVAVPQLRKRPRGRGCGGVARGWPRHALQSLQRPRPVRALHVVRDDALVVADEVAEEDEVVLAPVRREERQGRRAMQGPLVLA